MLSFQPEINVLRFSEAEDEVSKKFLGVKKSQILIQLGL